MSTQPPQVCPSCGALVPPPPPQRSTGTPAGCIVAAIVGGVMLIVLVGGGVVFWLVRRNLATALRSTPSLAATDEPASGSGAPPASGGGSGGGSAANIVSWVGNPTGSMCFADADGDGKPELLGYGTDLMAVSLKTGHIVWQQGKADGATPVLYCNGGTSVVSFNGSDLVLRGIDPSNGAARWSAKLSDKLEHVSFGDGCLVAHSSDGVARGLDARTGKDKACTTPPDPAKKRHGHRHDEEMIQGPGDLWLATSSSKGPGTPRVVVRATRGGTEAWSTKLPSMESKFGQGAAIAADAHGVYVAGKQHGAEAMVVVMLNPTTGAVVATRIEARVKKADSFFLKIATTKDAVLVESFGMLHVYDARELVPLWWAGTMWAKR